MRPTEARRRFSAGRVARLATVAADGAPHLVPVVFALLGESVYSVVDEKPKRTPALRRLENVRATGRVALLVDHYEEDWRKLWWARADGDARVLGDGEAPEARRGVAALRERYPQQRAAGAILVVDVRRWSGWSAADQGDDAR